MSISHSSGGQEVRGQSASLHFNNDMGTRIGDKALGPLVAELELRLLIKPVVSLSISLSSLVLVVGWGWGGEDCLP